MAIYSRKGLKHEPSRRESFLILKYSRQKLCLEKLLPGTEINLNKILFSPVISYYSDCFTQYCCWKPGVPGADLDSSAYGSSWEQKKWCFRWLQDAYISLFKNFKAENIAGPRKVTFNQVLDALLNSAPFFLCYLPLTCLQYEENSKEFRTRNKNGVKIHFL